MATDFASLFLGMLPDTLIAQPVTTDGYGTFLASGSSLSIPCRIEGGNRLVMSREGKQVVSTVQVITGGVYGLTVDRHRYTLPSRFGTSSDLQAINILSETDESGPAYEEVYL
jgi:hypothetical protein